MIKYRGETITAEQAMKWFCWSEIVEAMEKNSKILSEVSSAMKNKNAPEWEKEFLEMYISKSDLII